MKAIKLLISEVKNELLKTKPLILRIENDFLIESSIKELIEQLNKTTQLLIKAQYHHNHPDDTYKS